MKKFYYALFFLLIFSAAAFASVQSDQDVYGVNKREANISHKGDRTLIETGGFPATKPEHVSVINGVDVTSNRRIPGFFSKDRPMHGTYQDWGTDIEVVGDTLATEPFLLRDKNNGDLYVVYKWMGSSTIKSCVTMGKSTDDGATWNYVHDYWVDDTTEIYNLDATIDVEGDSSFIFVICNAQDDDIWLLRYNITGDYSDWVEITTGHVYDPAMDQLELSGSSYLYMTYLVYNNTLRFRASTNYGKTWSSSYDVATGATYANPDIRVNVANNIWAYIIWDNGPAVRSKANDYQGFNGWAGLAEKTHNFRGSSDDMFPKITAAYGCDTVWVVANENLNNSGDWNLVWDYSLNGSEWRCDTMLPDIDLAADPTRDEYCFDLLYNYSFPSRARTAYLTQASTSDIRVDYQYFTGTWSLTSGINDYLPKPTAPSVNTVISAGGGVLVYAGHSSVWYDYYSNTDVNEEEKTVVQNNLSLKTTSLSRNVIRVEFTLPMNGNISLKAYDRAGRLIGTLINGNYEAGNHSCTWDAGLTTGQYFLRLATGNGIATKSVIILK